MSDDIERLFRDVTFDCRRCGRPSRCTELAEDRDRVYRLMQEPNEREKLVFFCEHCETANEIGIPPEVLSRLFLGR